MTAALISTTDRPYQLLPPLSAEQRDVLRDSIQKNGVLEPVVFDEEGEILDGHHRVEIAEELGVEYPRRVLTGLDQPDKHMFALTVNVARRQLDHEARKGLVAQLRLRGMSIRDIAKVTGIPRETVRRDVSGDPDGSPERITGSDRKSYAPRPKAKPAETPPPAPEPDITPDVLSALAHYGANGATAWQVAFRLKPDAPGPDVDALAVPVGAILDRLAAEGLAHAMGAEGGFRWILAELVDQPAADPEEEPAEAPTKTAGTPRADSDAKRALDDAIARDSTRRAAIRNLTTALTMLNPISIAPAKLAENEYGPVLDAFEQRDLDRAAETMAAIAALKRAM